MAADLSPENEQFVSEAVAHGLFQDRGQALDEAVSLLRGRVDLLRHIDEGTAQLRSGQAIELRGNDELLAFFERIHLEGMGRLEAERQSR